MCKWGKCKVIKLNGKDVSVDSCIANLVKLLNDNYKPTVASCCGHGNQPTRISFRDDTEIFITDYEKAQKISKMFPKISGEEQIKTYMTREEVEKSI